MLHNRNLTIPAVAETDTHSSNPPPTLQGYYQPLLHVNASSIVRLAVYIKNDTQYTRGMIMKAKEETQAPPHIVVNLKTFNAMFIYIMNIPRPHT